MKKQSLMKGTIILGISGVFAKFLGLFFRWPLIMLIGDEGVGYYQMSYPLYMFFVAMASGIPVAISKLVSERKAIGDKEGIIQVFRKSMLLMILLGGGFTGIILALSKQLIGFFKWDEKAYYSLIGIAIAPVFISIMSAFRGFFQGLQNMNPTAVSQIIEQIGRVIFGIGLAFILLPKGIEYAAGGAAFGAAAGGILGGIYLFIKYVSTRREINVRKVGDNLEILTRLIYISIPISLGATVGSIMSLIDSALVPQKLLQAGFDYKEATILYGQLTGKAFVLVNVPLTVSMALCASLVPIIAECYILNRKYELIEKTHLAIKFSMVIAIPSFLGLFFLALPVMRLLFPGHSEGFQILKYLSISIPFIVLCQASTAILQGVGRYIRPVINLVIGCIIKIILTIILVPIPSINIYGAVIGSIIGYFISAVLNMKDLRKTLSVSINYYNILIKPLYAGVIMIIGVLFIFTYTYNYTLSNTIACLAAVFSGILIYSILIIVMGIFSYDYFKSKFSKYKRRGIR
ncbi:Stage V sporulation protein B [Clostridium liquoris]|jgi:stage V sporulation protein B|uniref:Stage V sporulation protein B n=1 Tax=Clostridium liquoris TaxID=1289519 RepID=A0A2T0B0R1_9CLOT|nr:polysaccharide biosynthesis protein [Clostridium liquoris]PRR77191.1 Stage V sporulation protein B [Clostridium liquoris]